MKLGIREDIISCCIELFDKELELSRIKRLIDKQIKTNHSKSEYLLKKKLLDYLVNLGYTKECVIASIADVSFDDEDIKKKEYDKLYKKLSKKYTGKELEYKLKQKLYQKFYSVTLKK